MKRAKRWLALLGVLCLTGPAFAAIAGARTTHSTRHRASHTKRHCRRVKHRHCRSKRSAKHSHLKQKRHTTSKRSSPGSNPSGATPGTTTAPSTTTSSGTLPAGPIGEAPPVESPTAPATPARIEVTAEDTTGFHFVLSRPTVPAGTVIIEFINHGQDEHNLNAVEPTEGSPTGSLPNTAPNAHPHLTVHLHHGSYVLFCSLAGHEAKGMKATLVVE